MCPRTSGGLRRHRLAGAAAPARTVLGDGHGGYFERPEPLVTSPDTGAQVSAMVVLESLATVEQPAPNQPLGPALQWTTRHWTGPEPNR